MANPISPALVEATDRNETVSVKGSLNESLPFQTSCESFAAGFSKTS